MMRRYLVLVIFLLFQSILYAQTALVGEINRIFNQNAYAHAQIGIAVVDNTTGQVLFEKNKEQLFIPASVLKLVTTATALEILGPDYQFKTRLCYSGKIENGTLHGDLIIIGGGDPALGSAYFNNHYFAPHFLEIWTNLVGEAGIKKVDGRIVIDNTFYGNEKLPPSWTWEDLGNYYGAGSGALAWNDNLIRITFASPAESGLPTRILSISPEVKGLVWHNEVLSSDVLRDRAYVFGSPIDNQRIIRGTIPKNRKSFTIKASNPYPDITFAEEFKRYLSDAGIQTDGDIAKEKIYLRKVQFISELHSPPLYEIIKVVNHESVNLFAEHLVKQLAAEEKGFGDRKAGLEIISEYWSDKVNDNDRIVMEDGSGLSHFNVVTPSYITSMLRFMKNTSIRSDVFIESLPGAGTGTLRVFNPAHFPGNSLRLKSGSMKRIRCYAGYVTTNSGKDVSVAFLINHFDGNQSKLTADLEHVFKTLKED